MHKSQAVLNAFHAGIATLKDNALIKDVVKTNVDTEQAFPLISVTMGGEAKRYYTKQQYQHDLTIFTDIYVRANNKDLDDQMLEVRELIELKV
jgi:hypothetical protein